MRILINLIGPKNVNEVPCGLFQFHFCCEILLQKGTLWRHEKIFKQSLTVSSGFVCYAKKKEELLWFSSLGQMVQFGHFKFGRTL